MESQRGSCTFQRTVVGQDVPEARGWSKIPTWMTFVGDDTAVTAEIRRRQPHMYAAGTQGRQKKARNHPLSHHRPNGKEGRGPKASEDTYGASLLAC